MARQNEINPMDRVRHKDGREGTVKIAGGPWIYVKWDTGNGLPETPVEDVTKIASGTTQVIGRPDRSRSEMSATGAARATRMSMNPDLMTKIGFAEGAPIDERMAKCAAYAENGATPDELKAMSADLDADDKPEAKAMAAHFKAMSETPKQQEERHAEIAQGLVDEEKAEAAAMSALAQSLRARGMTVPATATRAQLMSMAAALPTAPPSREIEKAVAMALAKRDADAAAAAEKSERDGLVIMARSASAAAWQIAALETLPIAMAREAAKQYGPTVPGAPAHLFSRTTAQGGPVGANPNAEGGARTMSGPAMPKIHTGVLGNVMAPDEAEADAVKAMAFSQDAGDVAKLTAQLGRDAAKAPAYERLIAAGKVIERERPDLVEGTRRIKFGMVS